MITRMTQLFFRTLREDPADAEVPSHRLLVRAGYIRRVAPGIYTWLPLGLQVLHRVEQIVREEMQAMGAQEVHLPALLPRDPYEASGRWSEYGQNLFRLVDRKGADMLLGPTHEEIFTLTVKDLYSSYKDLPLALFQIQTKYRDEVRPRAGLLRGREFLMKDSYSFDVDDEGLEESYRRHREAYIKIFDRLGFDYVIVQAMAGAMGGSKSEEFLAVAANGEDTFVRSPGGYAANVEAVKRLPGDPVDATDVPATTNVDTPDAGSIEKLIEYMNDHHPRADRPWKASDTLKNILFMVMHPDQTRTPLAIGVPGDRDIDLKRLAAQMEPALVEPFSDADFEQYPHLVKGYIGPQVLGVGDLPDGAEVPAGKVRYLVDPRVVDGTNWLTGANLVEQHAINLVAGRDFTHDGYLDVVELREGDEAPDGSGPLTVARGIEMGHIFQLGRKYAEALGLQVLDKNGKLVTVTMGSYGVGLSRAVAAIAEGNHDEKGLCWPREVTPYDVMILATGKDEEIFAVAERLAGELSEQNISVLLDDRKASPGVKFTDAELLGVPTIVVVGRGLAEGLIELRDRSSGERRDVAVADATAEILAAIRQ